MYFPKSQITTDLYTNGNEYVYAGTDKEYIGYYFQTSNGKYYTGKNPNDPPIKELVIPKSSVVNDAEEGEIGNYSQEASLYLIPDAYAIASNIGTNAVPPKPPTQIITLPTEKDYDLEEYQRYFTSKDNEVRYTEIDKEQYEKFINQEPDVDYSLYTAFKLPWLISGNRNKTSQVNKNTVSRISNNLKLIGFNSYFKGKYDQYFKYNINEGLYTDGNEFINSFTKKPYIGFYHIHPEKGPMVGAQHIEGPHAYLYAIKEHYKQKQTGSLRITSSMDEAFEYGGYNFKKGSGIPPAPIISLSFITTWNVPSNNFNIIIGLDPSKTYNFTVNWGDGSEETINSNNDLSHTYSNIGEYTVTIDGVFPRIMMNRPSATHDNLISINNWGNIQWENMFEAFKNCKNLQNGPNTDIPDVSNTTDMVGMFENAGNNVSNLTIGNINNWKLSTITKTTRMFKDSNFKGSTIENWDVSAVFNFANMFKDAPLFNSPLSNWDTSALTGMGSMFQGATLFNQNIDHFKTTNATNFKFVFQRAINFNQPLNSWDVSNGDNMSFMFQEAREFNQPLNNWNVSNVKEMEGMFGLSAGTTGIFDQDLSSWKINKCSNFKNFLRNQRLSVQNYKNLLIGWEQSLQNSYPNGTGYPYLATGVTADFGNSQYASSAASARLSLETNYNWTITDGGPA
jgi:hypothetical protein